MPLEASRLQHQHYITHEIDFGQVVQGGGCGRARLSTEQLRELIAKLGACSGVATIDLGGEGMPRVWWSEVAAVSADAGCISHAVARRELHPR